MREAFDGGLRQMEAIDGNLHKRQYPIFRSKDLG